MAEWHERKLIVLIFWSKVLGVKVVGVLEIFLIKFHICEVDFDHSTLGDGYVGAWDEVVLGAHLLVAG